MKKRKAGATMRKAISAAVGAAQKPAAVRLTRLSQVYAAAAARKKA